MCSYLVCATPRSGSTLLCELLNEHRRRRPPRGVLRGPLRDRRSAPSGRLSREPAADRRRDPRRHLAAPSAYALLAAGARELPRPPGADVRARYHRQRRVRRQADVAPSTRPSARWPAAARVSRASSCYELLERLFARSRLCVGNARDKVRQAVSLWRALQTRTLARTSTPARAPNRPTCDYRLRGHRPPGPVAASEDQRLGRVLRPAIGVRRTPRPLRGDLEPDRTGAVRPCSAHRGRAARRAGARPSRQRQADASQRSGSRRTIAMRPERGGAGSGSAPPPGRDLTLPHVPPNIALPQLARHRPLRPAVRPRDPNARTSNGWPTRG